MGQPSAFPYESLIEQNICGIYRTTPSGNIVFCNLAFAKMLGYNSPSELINTNAGALYFDTGTRSNFIEQLQKASRLQNYATTLRKKDGSVFHGLENVSAFTGDDGSIQYLDGAMIDITEQVNAVAALQESEQKFRRIVDTAQEGIWVLDANDKTNFVNPKLCEMLGYEAHEMIGKELYDFMDEEGKIYAKQCMQRRREGAKDNMDIRYKTRTGEDLWCNISTAPIFNADAYEGALAMVTDITEKRRVEKEREQLIADLSERNKGLGQFTYIVSHNLRAPVANIMSLANLMRDATPADTDKFLQGIEVSANALNTIIGDLHDILRVRNGSVLQKEDVSFPALVETITGSINVFIKGHNATFVQDFSAVDNVFTVRSYLYSIFYNLIINGVKYAKPGIHPVIRIQSFRANGHVGIMFNDNGKGLDLDRVEKDLFGLYKRFDLGTEGKGMGLFMVKAQVESLGGSISVESKPGEGATFIVLLPS